MDGYSAKILEHAKYPRKFGRIADPDLKFEEVNPLCGDRIRVELRLTGMGAVEEISFSGEMCAIAKATASILFASIEGMTPLKIWRSDPQIAHAVTLMMASRGCSMRGSGTVSQRISPLP